MDKFESCQGENIDIEKMKFKRCPPNCPDRTVEPNCHMTCEGYLFRCEKLKKMKEGREENLDYYGFKTTSINRTRRIMGQIK